MECRRRPLLFVVFVVDFCFDVAKSDPFAVCTCGCDSRTLTASDHRVFSERSCMYSNIYVRENKICKRVDSTTTVTTCSFVDESTHDSNQSQNT